MTQPRTSGDSNPKLDVKVEKGKKPVEKPRFETERLKAGDWPDSEPEKEVDEEELADEGKPELETPEKKAEAPPKDAPRDEQAPLEIRVQVDGRKVAEATVTAMKLVADPAVPVGTTLVVDLEGDEVAELYRHVAHNPVDSHAPVWGPRIADPEGGY